MGRTKECVAEDKTIIIAFRNARNELRLSSSAESDKQVARVTTTANNVRVIASLRGGNESCCRPRTNDNQEEKKNAK